MRRVVLLCGPPGAGKTTAARASGLAVFDRDDPRWGSEREFTEAIAQLREHHTAQAVVIRAGASSSARRKAADLIGATHVYLLRADQHELMRRVHRRDRADRRATTAGIVSWFDRYDRDDGVLDFPGWPAVTDGDLGLTSIDWD